MEHKKLTLSLLIILISFSGCSKQPEKPQIPSENDVVDFLNEQNNAQKDNNDLVKFSEWKKIGNGIELKEIPITDDENNKINTLSVIKIDTANNQFSILQDIEHPKTTDKWLDETNSNIIINGGYFNEDYSPSGGLIVDFQKYGTLTHTGKNGYTGMILINDDIELRYLPEKTFDESENPKYGLQTFPTLILPGSKAGIENDSGKYAKRSIIAKDNEGNILLITSFRSNLTLYEVMKILLNSDLNIYQAFNLDGGPSSGISIKTNLFEYSVPSAQVPNVISVTSK